MDGLSRACPEFEARLTQEKKPNKAFLSNDFVPSSVLGTRHRED